MSVEPIRLLLLDRQCSYAEMLAKYIDDERHLAVIGLTAECDALPAFLSRHAPQYVVVDIHGFPESPVNILSTLCRELTGPSLIVLSNFSSRLVLRNATRSNVAGYLLKQNPLQRLVDNIATISQGNRIFPRLISGNGRAESAEPAEDTTAARRLCELTDRQLEIIQHLVEGASVKQVAARLHLSYKAVDSHKYRIMNKLGLNNRVDLTRLAIREGLAVA